MSKRKSGQTALALTLVLSSLSAQAATSAESVRDSALADNQAWELLSDLTTRVGSRLAGSAGDARAVAWAEAQLKRLGFDRVWTEAVGAKRWRRGLERARVLGASAQALAITALGGSIGTGSAPLEAEVVRVSDLAALRAATAEQLTGRIVFVDFRMQRDRDGAGYSPASSIRYCGPEVAAQKGAAAFLLRSAGTDSHRFPHTGNTKPIEGAAPIPAAALSNPDADQLGRLLGLAPVRLALELDVGFDGDYTSANVIGELRGRELPDETILIGGHLDSWDPGTGAVDDGAGIAITFAAGAHIAKLPRRPRRSIRVVAFAAEETGLVGAKAYAATHAESKPQHVLVAESDFGAGRIYAFRIGAPVTQWPEFGRIAKVLAPLGIEARTDAGYAGADVGRLADAGVPWAQLAQDGSDYFDLHHTPDDTLDKVDPAALDQQVAAYATLAYMAAEAELTIPPQPKIEPKADCPVP